MSESPTATGWRARLAGAALEAVPSAPHIVFGSAIWGIAMAVTAMAGMWMRNGLVVINPLAIAGVYFYGGSLAFAPALWLSNLWLGQSGKLSRFAGAGLLMVVVTHLATSAIFALQYRVFYAHWHSSFPSLVWFFQLAFTSAGAIFTFTVGSLTYYWPLSCLAFLGFGLWFVLRGANSH